MRMVIRSIPANRLYASAAGAGGDQFFSYNSTTAVTVWGKPVVPSELRDDPQFKKLLDGALTSQAIAGHVNGLVSGQRISGEIQGAPVADSN